MNKQNLNLIRIISTGVVVTILFSLVLFWGRFYCWAVLIDLMPERFLSLTVRPSGLVPGEPTAKQSQPQDRSEYQSPEPNEPNYRFSQIFARRAKGIIVANAFDAFWDITEQVFPFHDANDRICYLYGGKDVKRIICIDKRNGLIIRNDIPEPNNKELSEETLVFAGPNGISEKSDSSLGRFSEPVIIEGFDPDRVVLYDRGARRFYIIDFAGGKVNKGLQLEPKDNLEPIVVYQTSGITKWFNTTAFGVSFSGPKVWNAEKKVWESDNGYRTLGYLYCMPLLDEKGQIHIYNTDQQKLVPAGYLPAPMAMFSSASTQQNEIANPRNVLAYEILPVYAVRGMPGGDNNPERNLDAKYLGMIACCVSREGAGMSMAIFDPNGRQIYRSDNDWITSSEPTPTLAKVLLLLENLQPPVFELASYLCGDRIEAGAGHRALFILPNSFIGMAGRGVTADFLAKQFAALMLILPSLILAIWLAWRIRKDAILVGLSRAEKKWWLIGTLAFGLPAYITY